MGRLFKKISQTVELPPGTVMGFISQCIYESYVE